MFYKTIIFHCDHPGCTQPEERFVSIDTAREFGWAISRDRMHCYCPKCAPMHRNVGRKSFFANGNLEVNGYKYKQL